MSPARRRSFKACVCGATGCERHGYGRSGWARHRPPTNAYAYSGDWPHRVRKVLERDGFE